MPSGVEPTTRVDAVSVDQRLLLYTSCLGIVNATLFPIPPCLHRLDARPGLRSDVSDALLRLVAGRQRQEIHFFYVVATGWDSTGAFVPVSGRNLIRPCDRQITSEGLAGEPNCGHDMSARG